MGQPRADTAGREEKNIMARSIRDGWHTICGCEIYVEDGFITRGVSADQNGNRVSARVFRSCKSGGWDKEDKITPAAFRAGFNRGTIRLF